MSQEKITFISTRGRGMDTELKLIKNGIALAKEDVSFQYFIKNEITDNKAYVEGLKSMKKTLIDNSDHVICMDMSINVKVSGMAKGGKRVLMMAPFNYLHEAMFQKQNNPKAPNKKGAVKFTHVYSTSPFNTELLAKTYNTKNVKIIEGFATPYAHYIADEKVKKEHRELLEFYFPNAKGKKIIAMMLRGKMEPGKEKWFLPKVDWAKFLDSLGDEWFFVTDNPEILELASVLPADKYNNFGYTNRLFAGQKVCAVSDILITNYGLYAGYQASKRQPFYTMPYNNSNYERYIKKNYPELSIDNEQQLLGIVDHATKHVELHREASEYYSYAPDKDIIEDIAKLLSEQ